MRAKRLLSTDCHIEGLPPGDRAIHGFLDGLSRCISLQPHIRWNVCPLHPGKRCLGGPDDLELEMSARRQILDDRGHFYDIAPIDLQTLSYWSVPAKIFTGHGACQHDPIRNTECALQVTRNHG